MEIFFALYVYVQQSTSTYYIAVSFLVWDNLNIVLMQLSLIKCNEKFSFVWKFDSNKMTTFHLIDLLLR